jgi:predicted Fe-Mo cluster-binding NifX family protein
MIVAITSDGIELISFVAEKFGRAPFIIFYDTEENTFESLRNPYSDLFGGAGIQTAQFIIEKNASAVITVDIGSNPLRFLLSTDVKVFSCLRKQVNEVVKDFLEEKLPEVKQENTINFGRKRHGGIGRN